MAAEESDLEIEDLRDTEAQDEFVEGDYNDNVEATDPSYANEIAQLISLIGQSEPFSSSFTRDEHCHDAIRRLEYLLRSEFSKNRRIKDDYDDDQDNNEIFTKCSEFGVFHNKLVPCFKSLMQDIIKYGIKEAKSHSLLQSTQRLMKMFTRFTFSLTHDINNKSDYFIKQNKYHQFIEYQIQFKKTLIEPKVLYFFLILMESECGVDVDPDERNEMEIDSLELYLCLLRNILSIPNAANGDSDEFVHDRAIEAFQQEKVMEVLVELSVNLYEESEKIQYLMMDIFYQYFKMENAEAMMTSNNNDLEDTVKQYKMEKMNKKNKLKRSRHNKWGGLSRVQMMNGDCRIQSLATNTMSNDNMFDRRKQSRFRPIKEKKKRIYLSDKVRKSSCFVADILLDKAFTILINTMFYRIQSTPEFQLTESSDCKKWFSLVSLFLQYHRIKTRKESAAKARRERVSFKTLKWYSSSQISCVLNENVITFILKRIESLIESKGLKHITVDFERIEQALTCYKEIIRSIYAMIEYGNEANKANGLKLFAFIFEDHRGPQLITDMIRDYKVHENTKLYLSYCIEIVYYTLNMINNYDKMMITTKKKKRKKKAQNIERTEHQEDEEKQFVEIAGMEIDDDIDEDDEDEMEFSKKNFDLTSFLKPYASNKVVKHYMYILEYYASNSAKLNSYIITLLDKIAFEMNSAPLLFQLSYFMSFSKILEDPIIAKDKKQYVLIKFCKKIVGEFFSRCATNKVLFCEILFHKTPHALSDINNPGSVHQEQIERAQKESQRIERRNNIEGIDDGMDDDFDDEEEYQELDVNITEWNQDEDNLLRNYYSTYAQQGNVAQILHDFLDKELQITRSEAQIKHRLRQLGLMKGAIKKQHNNTVKRRIKPKDMSINERKSIIYHCVHRACYTQNDDEKNMNKSAFQWICNILDNLCDVIGEFIDASSTKLIDDVAIVPIQLNEFDFMDNLCLCDLLTKLGYLPPNKYIGTMWWRIPREFKTTDVQDIIHLIKEALQLPSDVDLRALCGANIDSMDIALVNDDDDNERKEQSDAEEEEEYQIQPIKSEIKEENKVEDEDMEVIDDEMEREKKDKKKKKKKSKRDKKKKSKRDKKKKKKDKENGEKKKKKKKKSRKRKRDKVEADKNDNDKRRKRRKLNVNDNDNDDGDNFFDDVENEENEDEIEMQNMQQMNTPQIQKFQSLTLDNNNNALNMITENDDNDEDEDDVIRIKSRVKKSKRAFVEDSDSD